MTKVIHVHLIFEKKNFYFGSIAAVFDILDEPRIGISETYLAHAGLADGKSIVTRRAIVTQSHLIRKKKISDRE